MLSRPIISWRLIRGPRTSWTVRHEVKRAGGRASSLQLAPSCGRKPTTQSQNRESECDVTTRYHILIWLVPHGRLRSATQIHPVAAILITQVILLPLHLYHPLLKSPPQLNHKKRYNLIMTRNWLKAAMRLPNFVWAWITQPRQPTLRQEARMMLNP